MTLGHEFGQWQLERQEQATLGHEFEQWPLEQQLEVSVVLQVSQPLRVLEVDWAKEMRGRILQRVEVSVEAVQ